jgi:hypothetical protein
LKTGLAPTKPMTSVLLIHVKGTVITPSPGPTPKGRNAASRLSVPLAALMQCFTPTYFASAP